MNSTIQLNITLPPAAGGIPQEAAGNYSQGIQLHLSITLPTTASSVPLVQTTLATPTSRSYVENSLTEREADLRKALNQRRLKPITNGAVASVEGLSVTAPFHSSSLQTRAGSEGTSSDGTLCSNGPRSGETQSHRNVVLVVEQGDLHTDSSNTQVTNGPSLETQEMMVDDHQARSQQPCTPPGSPHRSRSASLQSEHRSPRAWRGRSRESKAIGNHRDVSPDSLQSRRSSSSRSRSVSYEPRESRLPPRRPRDDSQCSLRSHSTSLEVSYQEGKESCAQESPLPLALRVSAPGQDVLARTTRDVNDSSSHRIGLHPNHKRICPFYHKNQEDRHMNHAPHPGYTEEEFNEAVKIYARGDKLPPSLIKGNVEINWRNQNRSSPPSPTHVNPPPTKRRFERPPARAPATSTDNYEPPTKRPRLEQQSFDRRDQGMPQYDTTPRDLYVYGDGYADPPEYSPRSSPLRHRLSSPNDSRTQHRPDYFMNAPPRGVYERPRDVRTHWQ